MSELTPGEWFAKGNAIWSDVEDPDTGKVMRQMVCTIHSDFDNEEADIRLIAAAKSMLAVMEDMVNPEWKGADHAVRVWHKALEVIAKAKGESTDG